MKLWSIFFVAFFLPSTGLKAEISFEDYPPFVEECYETGLEELLATAEAMNGVLDIDSIKVDSVDDRWYSPSKYVWYAGTVEFDSGDASSNIIAMVQKSYFPYKACI